MLRWWPVDAGRVFRAAGDVGRASPDRRRQQREGGFLIGSAAVSEAPVVVACLDDIAMVGDAVEQRGGNLGIAEHGGLWSASRKVVQYLS